MKTSEIDLGGLSFDPERGVLHDRAAIRVTLRHQSARVLAVMARRPGEVISRTEFFDQVWPGQHVSEDSLAQCILDIRSKLGPEAKSIVETIPRKGYRLNPTPPGIWIRNRAALAFAAVVALIVCGAGVFLWREVSAASGPPVVAVLSFEDLSDDGDRGRLHDVIGQTLITDLARYPELKVIAPHSSLRFDAGTTDISEVAATLGADYILRGSQMLNGDRLRVMTQLIAASDGSYLWTDSFEVELDDLLSATERIGRRVASVTGAKIIAAADPGKARGEVRAMLMENQGRSMMLRELSRETMEAALALQVRAARDYPEAPWGHIGIALSLRNAVRWGWSDEPPEVLLERAEHHAQIAVRAAPDNYMAHYALGRVLMQRGDMAAAISELDLAARLNPASAMVLEALGQAHLYRGETARVLQFVSKAEEFDPLPSRTRTWLKAWGLWQAGDCHAAQAAMDQMSAPPVEARKLQAVIRQCNGERDLARDLVAEYRASRPGWSLADESMENTGRWTAPGALDRWLASLGEAGAP